jgi:hypothetical protein
MNQKVKQQVILQYLWILHTPKKLIKGHLLRPGPGSGTSHRRPDPDPDPTKKVRIRNTGTVLKVWTQSTSDQILTPADSEFNQVPIQPAPP